MRKSLVILVALLAAVAIAMPAFAGVEFKYGGLYRVRLQSLDNVSDGTDDLDDNANWIDQRLRMYFTFVASERLQVVTRWEADTSWGFDTGARHGGGDVGADATNLEMKNAYIDFLIPQTPVRAKLGVQDIALMKGWILNDDFSAAVFSTKFDPVSVVLGYIAGANTNVTDVQDNVDDYLLALNYATGPFSASFVALYQKAGDAVGPNIALQPNHNGQFMLFGPQAGSLLAGLDLDDNDFIDLGLSLGYKMDWMSAYVNFVKNLGSVEIDGEDADYNGWMLEAGADFFVNDFTFTLGGFYTSGQELDDDDVDFFMYPVGASHYWSEIMGLGTLDQNVAVNGRVVDRNLANAGYQSADIPSNLWTVSLGVAWQALPTTKLTLNYYYLATAEDVIAGVNADGSIDEDDTIGHELDFYLDQDVVDGLKLRLVGAYLFADDAYTLYDDDDDAYELGAQLLWSF